MEILLVFFLGYLLTKLQGSQRSRAVKVGAVVATVLLYTAGKVAWTVKDLPETLYQATNLTRSTRCEEVRSLYRSLAKEKHPDRNLGSDSSEDFIQFQQSFDTLGSPTLRIRYELYGRTEEDAMAKDLASHAGFYLQGLLLAYSLTCNKVADRQNTVRAGMYALVSLVLFGSVEWSIKSLPPATPPYGYASYPIHMQLELLRSFFFPLLLFLYVESGLHYSSVLETKKAQWTQYFPSRILTQVENNRSVLAVLAERRRTTPLPGPLEAAEKEEMVKRMMEAQKPKEKSKWRWVMNGAIILLVIYLMKNKAKAPPVRPGYPGYN